MSNTRGIICKRAGHFAGRVAPATSRRSAQQLAGARKTLTAVAFVFTLLALCARPVNGQGLADQASSAISLLLRQNQESACDGEQLEIKCNDDYVIEIITAELTILHKELHAGAVAGGTRAEPAPPAQSSSSNQTRASSGNARASGDSGPTTVEPAICQPLGESQLTAAFGSGSGDGGKSAAGPVAVACNEHEAHEASLERKARFLSLVRRQCSLLNSCLLDLKLVNPQMQAETNASTRGPQVTFAPFLAERCPLNRKLFELAYKCKPFRMRSKTVCRDSLLSLDCAEASNKRLAIGSAIYGFWPEDKKTHERCLLDEGRRTAETGTGSQTMQPNLTTTASDNQLLLPKSNCSTLNGMQSMSVLANECLFKRQCQVSTELFANFESSCPRSPAPPVLEYLKVVYVCINEAQLVTTNLSLISRQLISGSSSPAALRQRPAVRADSNEFVVGSSQSFASQNVSSSSLLASTSPQQQFITPPVNGGSGLLATLPRSEPHSNHQTGVSVTLLDSSLPKRPPTTSNTQQAAEDDQISLISSSSSRIYAVLASDPQLSSVHPLNWTVSQRVKFVLLRYQNQLIAFAVITITVSTILALVARFACQRAVSSKSKSTSAHTAAPSGSSQKGAKLGSTSSSSSSSSSSNSTNYTNQTNCTATVSSQQLLGMGTGLSALKGAHHYNNYHISHNNHLLMTHNQQSNYAMRAQNNNPNPVKQKAKTNSCSESCFSLDDYNGSHHLHQLNHPPPPFHQVCVDSSNADSPALQSSQTTPPASAGSLQGHCNLHTEGPPELAQYQWAQPTLNSNADDGSGARPKLWSFYGNEQHSNSLRVGNFSNGDGVNVVSSRHGAHNINTLRPQRTFIGQAPPTLARNFDCLRHQQTQQLNSNSDSDSKNPTMEQHQSDYLLAMAAVGRQHQISGDNVVHQEQISADGGGGIRSGWNSLGLNETANQIGGGPPDLEQPHLQLFATLNPVDLQQQHQMGVPTTCALHSQAFAPPHGEIGQATTTSASLQAASGEHQQMMANVPHGHFDFK